MDMIETSLHSIPATEVVAALFARFAIYMKSFYILQLQYRGADSGGWRKARRVLIYFL